MPEIGNRFRKLVEKKLNNPTRSDRGCRKGNADSQHKLQSETLEPGMMLSTVNILAVGESGKENVNLLVNLRGEFEA